VAAIVLTSDVETGSVANAAALLDGWFPRLGPVRDEVWWWLAVACERVCEVEADDVAVFVPLSTFGEGGSELAVQCRFVLSGAGVEAQNFDAGAVCLESFVDVAGPADFDQAVLAEEVDDAVATLVPDASAGAK